MTAAPLAGLLLVTGAYVLRAPLRRALVVLLGVTLLVPSPLQIPGIRNGYGTVHRLILILFCVNLIVRLVRGEVRGGIGPVTKVHVALLGYVGVTLVVGVVVAGRNLPVSGTLFPWSFVAEQFVLFSALMIVFREIDDPVWLARLVSTLLVVSALIAVTEHFTKSGYGSWWLHRLQPGAPGSFGLRQRGGFVRVRGAVSQPTIYAFIALALLPLLVGVVSRSRRLIFKLLPAVVILSIIWTYSRSAYPAFAFAAAFLVIGSRFDIRVTSLVAVGAIVGLIFLGSTGALRPTFHGSDTVDSSLSRVKKVSFLLGEAADTPFTGIGFSGIGNRGITTTDNSYIRIYAELGAFGFVAFVVLMLVMLAEASRGLWAPPGVERVLAAGVLAGIAVLLFGAAFHEEFALTASFRFFWVLVALGMVLGERARGVASVPLERLARRVWVPAIAVAAGATIAAAAPPVYAAKWRFQTIPARSEVLPGGSFSAKVMLNTACLIMEHTAANLGDARANCFDLRTGVGVGEVRVETDDRAKGRNRARVVLAHARANVEGFEAYLVDENPRSKATWVRTAPVWLGGAGIGAIVVVPFRRRAGPTRFYVGALSRKPAGGLRPGLPPPGPTQTRQ